MAGRKRVVLGERLEDIRIGRLRRPQPAHAPLEDGGRDAGNHHRAEHTHSTTPQAWPATDDTCHDDPAGDAEDDFGLARIAKAAGGRIAPRRTLILDPAIDAAVRQAGHADHPHEGGGFPPAHAVAGRRWALAPRPTPSSTPSATEPAGLPRPLRYRADHSD